MFSIRSSCDTMSENNDLQKRMKHEPFSTQHNLSQRILANQTLVCSEKCLCYSFRTSGNSQQLRSKKLRFRCELFALCFPEFHTRKTFGACAARVQETHENQLFDAVSSLAASHNVEESAPVDLFGGTTHNASSVKPVEPRSDNSLGDFQQKIAQLRLFHHRFVHLQTTIKHKSSEVNTTNPVGGFLDQTHWVHQGLTL